MKSKINRQSREFRLLVKQHAIVLDFTDAIEDELRHRKMNKKDLAKLLHKSVRYINKIFRDTSKITLFDAVEIATALKLNIEFGIGSIVRCSLCGDSGTLLNMAGNKIKCPQCVPSSRQKGIDLSVQDEKYCTICKGNGAILGLAGNPKECPKCISTHWQEDTDMFIRGRHERLIDDDNGI